MGKAETAAPKASGTTLMDVAKFDEIKQLGFRVEKLNSGWNAYEIHGDRKVGPFKKMGELLKEVKDLVGNKFTLPASEVPAEAKTGNGKTEDPEVLTHDSKGRGYLPGQEPVIPKKHKDLADAILKYDRIKLERVSLSNQETEAKSAMGFLLKKYEDDLLTDAKTGNKYYPVGDVRGKLMKTEKEEFGTEHAEEE